jgi:hypothetical protein
MAIIRFVFAALKPGVSAEDYERFEREVDYPVAAGLKTIVSYRTHRITETGAGLTGGPWDYASSYRGHRPRRIRGGTRGGRQATDRRALRKVPRPVEDGVGLVGADRPVSAAGTRWAGRVALVTGSSSGTGAEIAREFARQARTSPRTAGPRLRQTGSSTDPRESRVTPLRRFRRCGAGAQPGCRGAERLDRYPS